MEEENEATNPGGVFCACIRDLIHILPFFQLNNNDSMMSYLIYSEVGMHVMLEQMNPFPLFMHNDMHKNSIQNN